MKTLHLLIVVMLSSAATGLYGQTSGGGLRLVDAVSGSPSFDFFVDGNPQPVVTGMQFRDASQVLHLNAGKHTFSISIAGTGVAAALYTDSLVVSADTVYTFIAVGTLQTFAAPLLSRGLLTAVPGRTYVRGVHGCGDVDNLNVTVTDANSATTVVNDLAFGTVTGYTLAASGNLQLQLATSVDSTVIYRANGTMPPGGIVTLIVTGERTTVPSSFGVNMLVESDAQAQRPMPMLTATLGVRDAVASRTVLSIWPNPATSSATLSCPTADDRNVVVSVYDVLGRIQSRFTAERTIAGASAELRTTSLAPGVYQIRFTTDTGIVLGSGMLRVSR